VSANFSGNEETATFQSFLPKYCASRTGQPESNGHG
jgi:hypothetical protein